MTKYCCANAATAERWAGLWDFPRFLLASDGTAIERQVISGVRRLTGITVRNPQRFAKLRHGVTRFRITLDGFVAQSASAIRPKSKRESLRWVSPLELNDIPLNTTGRKLVRLWREHPAAV